MTTLETIKRIIAKQFENTPARSVAPEFLQPETAIASLNPDSLDLQEIIMAIEDEYAIEVPDARAENFKTLRDVVDFVDEEKWKVA